MFIESLPSRVQQAVYQQVMLNNRESHNVGDPMDVDITNAVPSKTARGSELLKSLSHTVAQAKNCDLLAGLNLHQNDPSNDIRAPPYTPNFAIELGYVSTMFKTSNNIVRRKSITIQGRAGFSKVALNQIDPSMV
jgi:hypothetical protein